MINDSGNELRALIFTPSGRDAVLTEALLVGSSIHTYVCTTFDSLMKELAKGAGCVLLSSETLTPTVIEQLGRYLLEQPTWSDLSIIALIGAGTPSSRRKRNSLLGSLWNATLLERPVRAATLVNTVEIALRARKRQYLMRDHLIERTDLEGKLEFEYQKQFRIAETLQRSMINLSPLRSYRGIDVDTLYLSAKDEADVGGDFFDVFAVDEKSVAIVVGDVSGKGLDAASKSLEVKYPLRAFLRQTNSPCKTLKMLNGYLLRAQDLEESGNTSFVCVSICIIDTDRKVLTWSNSGLEGPYIVGTAGGIVDLSRVSPPLGVIDADLFEDRQRSFATDETLLIYTDGISEARNGSEFFGLDGVVCSIEGHHEKELSELIGEIVGAASRFSEGVLADDVCIIAARLDGH